MHDDAQILATVPDVISVGAFLKASPSVEGGKRILYFEASNEGLDQENETIAAKALLESKDYFLRYGNIDIDHYTVIGPKLGIPKYQSYEIGRPIDVGQLNGSTFVKAEIYAGQGPIAEKANEFWSSLTDVTPPHRWYPSVAGKVLNKQVEVDPKSQMRKAIINAVRWLGVGVSKTPVNQHVGVCATVPMGVFAKSLTASGGLDIAKALEAGYGTDAAALTGGAALRRQSLQGAPANYFDLRNRLSARILEAAKAGSNPSSQDLVEHCRSEYGMSDDESAEHVERFMRDLKAGLERKN